MKKRLYIYLICVFLSFPYFLFSTHIVGGSLTYVYNGGSSYTITLKLYRDCSPTSANFPGSVTINVAGYNGASFTPSKDIVINLGTVTPVTPVLDPCAIAPNPLPCVQEGLYTLTVNNLPPNPGGYHLSYQIIARNLSLTNVNAACNCVGETYYAYIPGPTAYWAEDFALANGITVDNGVTAWSTTAGTPPPATASVNANLFEITGANNARQTWTSQVINISAFAAGVNLRVDLTETGTLDPNDSIFVYYRLNGGPLTLFSVNGFIADDFTSAVASHSALIGTTVQIVIQVHYDANSPNTEKYRFDNVIVDGNNFIQNNNPVFNLFPPLFLCVGQPFTFDHSATDTNGDSLYYSFYTPYNGDNGVGPLDPTFPGNVATFTPIVFQPGYSSTNPLGGAPLTLNPTTGLLTGTPSMLGQFVVGVVVKEYRNGVYLSQTLRDFQFNIVNCPQPPPTVGGTDIIINDGCTKTLNATGFNPATATWTSVYPGAPGAYNNYLSCTSGCLNPTVTAVGSPPTYVDYAICGVSTSCNPTSICDTVRVTFNPTLVVTIAPQNPTICFGQISTTLTATGSGGTAPYSYLWNSVNTSQSINAGLGTYTVKLSDASGCPPVYNSVTVTSFSVSISANAGPNQTVCSQGNPSVTLNGSVSGASGGIWSGGAGSYIPNNTTLSNLSYIPTAAEITAGSVNIYLTTTGNGSCPGATDTMVIFFSNFNGTVSSSITNVGCFGGNNGSATISVFGGASPFSYSWATVPAQTTTTVANLPIGTYSVTIRDNIGCSKQASITVSQPSPIVLNSTITNVSCSGGNNGSITIIPLGGTAPYNYSWMPGGQTTSSISNRIVGIYTVTVTDSNSCQKISTYSITQPLPVAISFTSGNVSCFNGNDGSANTSISGGNGSYTYNWTPINSTSPNLSGVSARTYTLTVTDNKGCSASNAVTITQPAAVSVTITKNNETCEHLNNGLATASTTGGTLPYTYLWQASGQITSSISNLSSGTYTLTVRDSKNCVAISLTTITEPVPLDVSFVSKTNINCFDGTDGAVTANPSGGTAPYAYLWMPGTTTAASKINLSAGTYTVTITDNNGCQTQDTTTITQPPLPVTLNSGITAISCNGGNNGAISITSSGGNGAYTYLWQPGYQTTSQISNLVAGTYTATITDSKGCQMAANYVLNQPSAIAMLSTTDSISCFNGSNGSISTTVTGGISPYTYQWNPTGSTSSNIAGLSARTYTLTVTDAKGCTAKIFTSLTQPAKVTATTTKTDETCSYLDNGTATVSASGGTPDYTYMWQPIAETALTISNLASGTYTLTTTDSKGCTGSVLTTISQPVPITISFSRQVNVTCFGGSNGKVTANPGGGTPNYKYSWMPGGATAKTISNLSAGTYTVTVTDNTGCQTQNTVTITEPLLPVSASVTSTLVSCYGGADGSVSVSASGGTASYTYKWMPGNNTGQTFSGLSAKTYTVTVKDVYNCLTTKTIAVNQPAPITFIKSSINSSCSMANGTASITASGGTSPYTYQWLPSGGTNASAPNLVSGAYSVIVTDNSGCTSMARVNVNDNSGPSATIFSITDVSCNGGSDGTATGGVSGGTPPFIYSWAPYGGTTITATGLSAGTYIFTVLDSNGCQSLATTTPQITEPPAIEVTLTTSNVYCFGGNNGTAMATATGGTPGFTYQWLPLGTTSSNINGLSASTYTLQVRDTKNCMETEAFTITQPALALSVTTSFLPISCNSGIDGSASATASGGTGPYDYNWMSGNYNDQTIYNLNANTYTVTSTDSMGCTTSNSVTVTQPIPIVLNTGSINSNCSFANGQASVSASGGTGSYSYQWSPSGGTNAIATGLLSETYTITVTDANGCSETAGVIVNDNPSPVATVSSTTNVSCNGGADGTATVSITGGASPFTYSWAPIGGIGSTATGLTTGEYTVVVSDANGCQSLPATSPVITEPLALSITISKNNVSCLAGNNGSATVSVSGGISGYTYQWLPSGITGSTISNLSANTYTLQVKDANNCILIENFTITQPTLLSSGILSSTNEACYGGDNGSATVTVSGGTSSYYYTWLPMGGSGPTATGLTAGTYTVSINDFNGCTSSSTVTITQPSQPLSATSTGGVTSCFGGSNGTATINTVGGTPGYFYQWSPSGGTNQSASGFSAGNYFVLVTDANGCQTNVSLTISEPSPLSGTLAVREPSCGLSNGSISPQISGGTSPYTYLWNPGSYTTTTINGLAPGTYSVQITDTLNCNFTLSENLTNIPGPTLGVASTTPTSCYGGNDGTGSISTNQGTSPFAITWLPYGGDTLSASSLIAGTYTVNVTDNLGCTASTTVNILQPPPVIISINSVTNVSCNGGSNGNISVSAAGGTGTYAYSWAPINSSSQTINNLTTGTYVVNVTDQNNCPASISINISQPTTLSSSIGSVVNPTCFNGTNGRAFVSATGGTVPYIYSWSTSPIQNGNIVYNISAGSYTITVTDNKGCTSTANVMITHPSQIITTAGVNDTICLGLSGVVTATASGGAGNYSYLWQPSGITNAGTLTVNPTTNTTYIVTAYDQSGCQGIDDSVSAIVYNLLPENVQATGLTPICPGQSSPIQVVTSGNTGLLTYSWNNGLGNGPGIYLVTPTVPTTYIVTVTNACGASVNDTVQILFSPPPTIILASDTTATCVPSTLQFYDNSITGNVTDQIHTWYWDFGDGTTSSVKDPVHIYTQPGTYLVNLTVTTGNGCTNSSSTPLIVNAYPFPIAAFSVNSTTLDLPYDKLICINQSVGAITYNWSFGDGGTSIELNPQYLYPSVGNFEIRLIAISEYGCPDTAYANVTTNADIVFPNVFTPSKDGTSGGYYNIQDLTNDIFFPYTSGIVEFKFEIFNRWGELIFETFDIKQGWDGYYRGQLCQQDVYVWKANAKFNNGKTFKKQGDVTLLR